MKIDGVEVYEKYLYELEQLQIKDLCGSAIHAGAGVIADAIRREVNDLPTHTGMKHGDENNKIDTISKEQTIGLKYGLGISRMRFDNGYYNVKVGFDGYNDVRTRNYPEGQPNALIARSVNSGTSFRQKNPFVDRAVRRSRRVAEAVMVKAFDENLKKLLKGR